MILFFFLVFNGIIKHTRVKGPFSLFLLDILVRYCTIKEPIKSSQTGSHNKL